MLIAAGALALKLLLDKLDLSYSGLVIENGFVLLPMEAPWLADYLAELTAFPDHRWTRSIEAHRQD